MGAVPATAAEALKSDLDSTKQALARLLECMNLTATAATREPAAALWQAARGLADSGLGNHDP